MIAFFRMPSPGAVCNPPHTLGVEPQPAKEHRATEYGRPGRSPGDKPTGSVNTQYLMLDWRIADEACDPELIAAGEEDAFGLPEFLKYHFVEGIRAFVKVQPGNCLDPELCEDITIGLQGFLGLARGDCGKGEFPVLNSLGHFAENDPFTCLVFASPDDDERSWSARRVCTLPHAVLGHLGSIRG